MTNALRSVGPVLLAGEVSRAIVAAIRAQHHEVEVQDRGAYLRVLVPATCRVTRAAIERELGRAFRLPSDLELVMPSFKGVFRVSDEEASWEHQRA
jgi:hypothetical protein